MKSDSSGKPFIKKFSDGGFFYIYDVNTNRIVEVEKDVYDVETVIFLFMEGSL